MTVRKSVLVTGHRGYIGAVMAPYLLRQGYDVVGLDVGYFDECTLVPDPVEVPAIKKDIRDLVPADLESFYAIVHLAALSNDPIGNLDERWTDEINTHTTTLRRPLRANPRSVDRSSKSTSTALPRRA